MIYKITGNKLQHVREKNVLEREVQDLFGENLELLMNLEFVDFEYSIENIRIDILAFDRELNAPVIIELKKDNSKSLFDQGMEYFHILLNRKSDFVLKLHQKLGLPADEKKISWENSRVIFIGKNFSLRQKRAVDFSNIAIELFDYDFYDNGIFKLEPIGLEKQAKLETSKMNNDTKIAKISREIKTYDREHHKQKSSPETWELFESLEKELLNLDDVNQKILKVYIAFFSSNNANFATFHFRKNYIWVDFAWKKGETPNIKNHEKINNKWVKSYQLFCVKLTKENFDDVFLILKKSMKYIKEL